MKRKRFSVEQIVAGLKQAEMGLPVSDLIRQLLWAAHHHVTIDFSRPGKPTDNAHVESFNGTLRKEYLNAHWFESLQEAKGLIEAWRREANESRPHRALQERTPVEFARAIGADGGPEGRKTAGDSP